MGMLRYVAAAQTAAYLKPHILHSQIFLIFIAESIYIFLTFIADFQAFLISPSLFRSLPIPSHLLPFPSFSLHMFQIFSHPLQRSLEHPIIFIIPRRTVHGKLNRLKLIPVFLHHSLHAAATTPGGLQNAPQPKAPRITTSFPSAAAISSTFRILFHAVVSALPD